MIFCSADLYFYIVVDLKQQQKIVHFITIWTLWTNKTMNQQINS